jgi:hypothetical protein
MVLVTGCSSLYTGNAGGTGHGGYLGGTTTGSNAGVSTQGNKNSAGGVSNGAWTSGGISTTGGSNP